MAYVFMFPGQGSQAVGMGKDLYDAFPLAKKRFDEADAILGRSISKICFEGPEDDLKQTQNTQPALFTIESAIADLIAEKGVTPAFTMGHSLGEYSALYAAGALSFEAGLKLVAKRGELMAKAGTVKPGTMAAIIGLEKEKIAEILKTISGIVVCANENTPVQTVISGEVEAVKAACEAIKAAGAKRAILLPVSGAFHSPLMQDAANEFSSSLAQVSFAIPRCPVITNVTAQAESDPETLKGLLVKQLVSPVRWVDSVKFLAAQGSFTGIEAGPGAVVAGLVKAIAPELNVVPCSKAENVYSLTA